MSESEPEVFETVVRYRLSCVQADHPYADHFSIHVDSDRHGWAVRNRHKTLGQDGVWRSMYDGPFSDREPTNREEWDEKEAGWNAWLAAHRYDEQTALEMARRAAPALRLKGMTPAEVLEWEAAR